MWLGPCWVGEVPFAFPGLFAAEAGAPRIGLQVEHWLVPLALVPLGLPVGKVGGSLGVLLI